MKLISRTASFVFFAFTACASFAQVEGVLNEQGTESSGNVYKYKSSSLKVSVDELFSQEQIYGACLSPNGTAIAAIVGGQLSVFSADNGASLKNFTLRGTANSICWHSEDALTVVGNSSKGDSLFLDVFNTKNATPSFSTSVLSSYAKLLPSLAYHKSVYFLTQDEPGQRDLTLFNPVEGNWTKQERNIEGVAQWCEGVGDYSGLRLVTKAGMHNIQTPHDSGAGYVAVAAFPESYYFEFVLEFESGFYAYCDGGTGMVGLYFFPRTAYGNQPEMDEIVKKPASVVSGGGISMNGFTFTQQRDLESLYRFADSNAEAAYQSARRYFMPQKVKLVSTNAPAMRYIFHVGSSTDPGEYFLFNGGTGAFHSIGKVNPGLNKDELSPTAIYQIIGPDEVGFTAAVTKPTNTDSIVSPVIFIPNGSLAQRVSIEFDPMAQWLASRGFTVVRANVIGGFDITGLEEISRVSGYAFNAKEAWMNAMLSVKKYFLRENGTVTFGVLFFDESTAALSNHDVFLIPPQFTTIAALSGFHVVGEGPCLQTLTPYNHLAQPTLRSPMAPIESVIPQQKYTTPMFFAQAGASNDQLEAQKNGTLLYPNPTDKFFLMPGYSCFGNDNSNRISFAKEYLKYLQKAHNLPAVN